MLAHKASFEAHIAVDTICGGTQEYNPKAIPCVIFTDPQIAYCGLTEEQANAQGIDFDVTKFSWKACGKALTSGRTDGLTKIISEKSTGHILGVGIVGIEASELISEATLAIEQNLTVDDLTHVIHPHPTLSENLKEAADILIGECAHIFK